MPSLEKQYAEFITTKEIGGDSTRIEEKGLLKNRILRRRKGEQIIAKDKIKNMDSNHRKLDKPSMKENQLTVSYYSLHLFLYLLYV